MSKKSIEYLKHILLECDYIVSVIKPETGKDEFLKDETFKRAVVRSLEIIGEATKKIPADHNAASSRLNSQLNASCIFGLHLIVIALSVIFDPSLRNLQLKSI